jgi:RimJ/RimL family protein N-acetyltransferase
MDMECRVLIQGQEYSVFISDEPQALLAASAAGRAVIGVEGKCPGRMLPGADCVVPGFEDATPELAMQVMLRHLGLPWLIGRTRRLVIRELTVEDSGNIPEEEYGEQEKLFRSPQMLRCYIKNQYGFYEYGVWALVQKENGVLTGLAGVSNPKLPKAFEEYLEKMGKDEEPWLELGYHIFRPYRRQGYAMEAAREIMDYSHEVLSCRLCAFIHKENKASRALAEGLGMQILMEGEASGCPGLLLYGERLT